jgi:hypothetical protein
MAAVTEKQSKTAIFCTDFVGLGLILKARKCKKVSEVLAPVTVTE